MARDKRCLRIRASLQRAGLYPSRSIYRYVDIRFYRIVRRNARGNLLQEDRIRRYCRSFTAGGNRSQISRASPRRRGGGGGFPRQCRAWRVAGGRHACTTSTDSLGWPVPSSAEKPGDGLPIVVGGDRTREGNSTGRVTRPRCGVIAARFCRTTTIAPFRRHSHCSFFSPQLVKA